MVISKKSKPKIKKKPRKVRKSYFGALKGIGHYFREEDRMEDRF